MPSQLSTATTTTATPTPTPSATLARAMFGLPIASTVGQLHATNNCLRTTNSEIQSDWERGEEPLLAPPFFTVADEPHPPIDYRLFDCMYVCGGTPCYPRRDEPPSPPRPLPSSADKWRRIHLFAVCQSACQ